MENKSIQNKTTLSKFLDIFNRKGPLILILSAIAFIGGLVILGVKVFWPTSNKKSPSSSQGTVLMGSMT